jgi:glutamate:GABA antiporter
MVKIVKINNESSAKISIFALVLLISGAIDNIRNLPTTALFGSSLIFFFIVSAIIFLIPVSLVAAELSSTWSEEEGGVYSWVQHAFGTTWAFFTVWLQWINTLVWFPTILSFIAGTIAYLINPELAQNKYYLISVILITFWLLTYLGLSGLQASAKFASVCAIFGMIIPISLIIICSVIWYMDGHHIALHISSSNLLPHFHEAQSWGSLTAIMTSFLGMELAAVHVRHIHNPRRNFPRALLLSVILIVLVMLLGSLAIACILPANEISLVQGVMQTFEEFCKAYNLLWFMPIAVIMILFGSLGNMVNWVISPAKGLFLAADHGFLHKGLYRLNRHGVASRILILQAILVTILCCGFLLLPSVNSIYWLFTSLSTELYMFMYVLMFLAAIVLKRKFAHLNRHFEIPGGYLGYYITCFSGLIGCIITLIVGFLPPEYSMNMVSASNFRIIFGCGIIVMMLPAVILYLCKKWRDYHCH